MPCHDPINWEAEDAIKAHRKTRERLDLVTEALCTMCKEIEVILPDFIPARPNLHAWWVQHKAYDEQRQHL